MLDTWPKMCTMFYINVSVAVNHVKVNTSDKVDALLGRVIE